MPPMPFTTASSRARPKLESVVAEARAFAAGPYASALKKGALIGDEEKAAIARRMSELTGISRDYILRSNLRVNPDRFRRELLRDRRQIIGRIDSRYLGTESDAAGEGTSYDPQAASISGAFVGALNDYLFRDLGYKTPLTYRPNNYGGIGEKWDLKHKSAEGRAGHRPTPASTWPRRCARIRASNCCRSTAITTSRRRFSAPIMKSGT